MAENKWWGDRVVTEFTLPEKLQAAAKCKTVGMVELNWDEEVMAAESERSNMAIAHKFTRMAIATIDGRPVDQDQVEVQKLFNSSPKVRSLLNRARVTMSDPSDEDELRFLASAQHKVG